MGAAGGPGWWQVHGGGWGRSLCWSQRQAMRVLKRGPGMGLGGGRHRADHSGCVRVELYSRVDERVTPRVEEREPAVPLWWVGVWPWAISRSNPHNVIARARYALPTGSTEPEPPKPNDVGLPDDRPACPTPERRRLRRRRRRRRRPRRRRQRPRPRGRRWTRRRPRGRSSRRRLRQMRNGRLRSRGRGPRPSARLARLSRARVS